MDFREIARGDGDEVHLFVNVVRRGFDPMSGAVQEARLRPEMALVGYLDVTEEEAGLVRATEYSGGKYFRFLPYRRLFPELSRRVSQILTGEAAGVVFLYHCDEGVWGAVLRRFRDADPERVATICIQHGLFLPEVPRGVPARRLVNWVSERLWGFPVLGMGFGGAESNAYLVHGEVERDFLVGRGSAMAVVAPHLIKRDLLDRADWVDERAPVRQALFALPACVPGSEIECTLPEFLEVIENLVRALAEVSGKPVLIRPHPGRDDCEVRSFLSQQGLETLTELDVEPVGAHIRGEAKWVFSAHSTVIFEAFLLGLVPVAVTSRCFRTPLPFPCERVDASTSPSELSEILGDEPSQRYAQLRKARAPVEPGLADIIAAVRDQL